MRSRLLISLWCFGAVGFGVMAVAQPVPPAAPAPPPPPDTLFFMSNAAPMTPFGGAIEVLGSAGDIPGPVVKGKPYSARSITQSVQTLADGNRITQRNEARIYRDGEGRTRREQTFGGVGVWQTAGSPVTTITINDPVSGKGYVLDPAARTAREIRQFQLAFTNAVTTIDAGAVNLAPGHVELKDVTVQIDADRVGVELPGAAVGTGVAPATPGERVMVFSRRDGNNEEVQVFSQGVAVGASPIPFGAQGAFEPAEDLGSQVLEGLLVTGQRMVDSIPAGAMGNERPIEIVTERWRSADIDALVRHRYFDPRFGETTYELVNVVRGEPPADLFTVPAGYELVADAGPQAFPALPAPPPPGANVQIIERRTIVKPPAAN